MNIQLTFHGIAPSDTIRTHAEERAARLFEHREGVVGVKVALESPHHHHQHGHAFRVRIEVSVPGAHLVVSPRDGAEGHTDLHVAIDDAFRAAERRLREHNRVRRGDVKSHRSESWAARVA